jgi:hypothetical protein
MPDLVAVPLQPHGKESIPVHSLVTAQNNTDSPGQVTWTVGTVPAKHVGNVPKKGSFNLPGFSKHSARSRIRGT